MATAALQREYRIRRKASLRVFACELCEVGLARLLIAARMRRDDTKATRYALRHPLYGWCMGCR
jgi:hypothetical protein